MCGARLEIRDDDKPEVIRRRLEQYHSKTEPVVAHYERMGLLRRVDGSRGPEQPLPPLLGEHSQTILSELLGMDDSQVQALRDGGVV